MAIEDENNYGLSGVQVKELVAQIKKRAVSVGEDGSSHVEEADQIYTKTLQLQEAAFVYRTTAGDLSIETGEANLLKLYGKTVQSGHQEEIKEASISAVDPDTTITVDWAKLIAYCESISNFVYFGEHGTATFTYRTDQGEWVWRVNTSWSMQGGIKMSDLNNSWGITVNGNLTDGDTITVQVAVPKIGTLTTAKPTSFVSTGYNQYNATAGYAHVIGGQEYRIDDALHNQWNSLGFRTEPGGTHSTISLTNNRFTPLEDGYVDLNGVMADNVLIALVWSGTRDSDPYVAYSADTISIPTIDIDSASLPTASYGMPSVGNVADELDFEEQLYIQRIGHYAYSAENLETVEALGVDYWYGEEDIFYVLETPITYHLATSVKSAYTANDFGTEEIVGTSVAMPVMISYGNNLVDKLRNLLPIQAIGDKLEMDGTTLNVAQSALGDIKVIDSSWQNNLGQWLNLSALPSGIYLINKNNCVPTGRGSAATPFGSLVIVSPRRTTANNIEYVTVVEFLNSSNDALINFYITQPGDYAPMTEWHSKSIVDALTSTNASRPLSAAQGKVLKDLIDALDARVTALEGN